MPRTNATLVEAILADNYDGTTDVTQFIDQASLLVDRVATCAIRKGTPLTDAELEMIERLVASDAYTDADPLYSMRRTGYAMGRFAQRDGEIGPYMMRALTLDPSGCLNALIKKTRARGSWMGTPKGDQRTWENRNAGREGV